MTHRHQSKETRRETDPLTGDAATPSQTGRGGGRLPRDVGTRDELRRAEQDRTGVTRVTRKDEKRDGDPGGHRRADEGRES
jgi:hypothetical protein